MLSKLFSSSSKIISFGKSQGKQFYSSTVKRIYEPNTQNNWKRNNSNFSTLKYKANESIGGKDQNFSTTSTNSTAIDGTQTKEIKEWWNEKPFEKGTKEEVQTFFQTFKDGKYKEDASKFIRLNGEDLFKMTNEDFKDLAKDDIGIALFNDIQALKDPDYSLEQLLELWKDTIKPALRHPTTAGYLEDLSSSTYIPDEIVISSLNENVKTLWYNFINPNVSDLRSHFIMMLWTGVGLGKTRFGMEAPNLISPSFSNGKTKALFQQVFINFNIGPSQFEDKFTENELKWNIPDCAIGVRIAARVLFKCPTQEILSQIGDDLKYYQKFKLHDVMVQVSKRFGASMSEIIPLFIHIDEVQLAWKQQFSRRPPADNEQASLIRSMVERLITFRASKESRNLGVCTFVLLTGTSCADFNKILPHTVLKAEQLVISTIPGNSALGLAKQWLEMRISEQNPDRKLTIEQQTELDELINMPFFRRIVYSLGVVPRALWEFVSSVGYLERWNKIRDSNLETAEIPWIQAQLSLGNFLMKRKLFDNFMDPDDALNEKAMVIFLRAVFLKQRMRWEDTFPSLTTTVTQIANTGALYIADFEAVKFEAKNQEHTIFYQSFFIPHFLLGMELSLIPHVEMTATLRYTLNVLRKMVPFPLRYDLRGDMFELVVLGFVVFRSRIHNPLFPRTLSTLLPGCKGNVADESVTLNSELEFKRDFHQWISQKKKDEDGKVQVQKPIEKQIFHEFDEPRPDHSPDESPEIDFYSPSYLFWTCQNTRLADGRLCLETPDKKKILLVIQCQYSAKANVSENIHNFVNEFHEEFGSPKYKDVRRKFSKIIPVYITNREVTETELADLTTIEKPFLWIDRNGMKEFAPFLSHLLLDEFNFDLKQKQK